MRWLVEKDCDLILDNFGKWLAALIRAPPPAGTNKSIVLKDITNTDRTILLWSAGGNYFVYYTGGFKVGVGSSSTAPTRTDYHLGSLIGTFDGVWTSSSGQITFSGSVYLASGGTVRETGFYAY